MQKYLQRRMENNIRENNSVFFSCLLAHLLQGSSNLVFMHLWGSRNGAPWCSSVPLMGQGSWLGTALTPQSSSSAHLSHSLLLCSQPCLLSSVSEDKIPVRELQAPEYCLGNGWQSISTFTGTGIQSAQMDLKPNFRHNLYCFPFGNVPTRPQVLLRKDKKGENQIPEDFIPQTIEILFLQSHESAGELLYSHPSGKEVYGIDPQVSAPIDMKVVGIRKYKESFDFKCWKQGGGYSGHSSMLSKNQFMPHRIIYTSLSNTTSKTNYHLLIIHREMLIWKAC